MPQTALLAAVASNTTTVVPAPIIRAPTPSLPAPPLSPELSDLIEIVYLWLSYNYTKGAKPQRNVFFAKDILPMNLEFYLKRLAGYLELREENFIALAIYFSRYFSNNPLEKLHSSNIQRLSFALLSLGDKFLHDSNETMPRDILPQVSGIPATDYLPLEIAALSGINSDCYISATEYLEWKQFFVLTARYFESQGFKDNYALNMSEEERENLHALLENELYHAPEIELELDNETEDDLDTDSSADENLNPKISPDSNSSASAEESSSDFSPSSSDEGVSDDHSEQYSDKDSDSEEEDIGSSSSSDETVDSESDDEEDEESYSSDSYSGESPSSTLTTTKRSRTAPPESNPNKKRKLDTTLKGGFFSPTFITEQEINLSTDNTMGC